MKTDNKTKTMKTKILLSSFSILLLLSCDPNQSKIKADLNSRYTKFEIVEINRDSSNIYDAKMHMLSFKMNLSDGNIQMEKAAYKFIDKEWSFDRTTNYMDSITKELDAKSKQITDAIHLRTEPCFYVKYRIFKDEVKIEREEFYYLRSYDDGKKVEVLHRPCNNDEFLKENGFDGLYGPLEESHKFYKKFLEALTR